MTDATKRRAAELYAKRVRGAWQTFADGAINRYLSAQIEGRATRAEALAVFRREVDEWIAATMAACMREAAEENERKAR